MTLQRLTVIVVTTGIAIAAVMILAVPRLTGVDGQVIASGGPAGLADRPYPHRTVLALDPETKRVVAQAVADAQGRFELSLAPGPYLLVSRGTVEGIPWIGPLRVQVGLFGHTHARLIALLR